ncbi:MAG: thioredoxin domain-containing protein, partial [Phycisphaerales bacterium]|nr:thioredoxin domain-containing protein [Phycisphaerales bacterium]
MLRLRTNRAVLIVIAGMVAMMMIQEQAAVGQDEQSPPRTTDGRNRLGETTSPYLLQHAHNPVHWWPWGEEAFEAAREQNKPIFMSIGYSTCYWCHVMERESFEDQEVADYLNEHFIAIKVDREERPDVDEIYMAATQMINKGRGGWPMSVFLEPYELKPFYAGTYFPKEDQGSRRGFMSVLSFMSQNWEANREAVDKQANAVANAVVNRLTSAPVPAPIDSKTIQQGISALLALEDKKHGGFSTFPKFPMPIYSDFLMESGWNIPQVQKAVKKTLDGMLMGGMYDQVGGGFHRYSTDATWLVPHFEKMLYDNGQLLSTYSKAYELTQDETYASVLRETVEYVERELSSPQGGFLSAQDAETNHLEGETYLWRSNEIAEVLNEAGLVDDVDFALAVYGVDQGTNFKDPHHREVPATNVLYLVDHPSKLAKSNGLTREAFETKLATINETMLKARKKRDQPLTDDKVIASWNGLMIGGLADAGRVLGESRWIARAKRASDFIQTQMRSSDGRLLRTWRNGVKGSAGFL